ncbi:interleukin-6 receptor subunit alpha [Genypterus blacodes]|uniref:interleukin-6 receptor subunit alpha n=1 Tax=Genypterus blacodes TaxID=154954 RepID=UPI003F75D38D
MRVCLLLLCVLSAAPARGVFEGTCPRKDPPPGVLVVSPGSKLSLTCSGSVKVDGVKVSVAGDTSSRGKSSDGTRAGVRGQDSSGNLTGVWEKTGQGALDGAVTRGYQTLPTARATEPGEDGEPATRSAYTSQVSHTGVNTSPTAQTFPATSVSGRQEVDWEEMDGDYEDEDEEEGDGSRVTRGLRKRAHWKFNGMALRKGEGEQGGLVLGRRGATLSLPSATMGHSGKYTCQHRGKTFSLRVIMAVPPEHPTLSCYKKSPSSKIRCEWTLQQPITVRPDCYLLLHKGPLWTLTRSQCSFSPSLSRCWCALDHNEDERRDLHIAYLCVTSMAGNATSSVLRFKPLDILKPDPPSDVRVRQEEGQERRMTISWSSPTSWKHQDAYYELMYELSYRPIKPPVLHAQTVPMKHQRSYTITDIMPGVEYMMQLRTKDEFDGLWSNWSAPVYGHSWTAKRLTVSLNDDLTTTMYPAYESSGSDEIIFDVAPMSEGVMEVWQLALWISAPCVLLLVFVAAYIFRHKVKYAIQLQTLTGVTQCSESSQPSVTPPAAPEAQALVTFAPPHFKQSLPNEVEGEEEEGEKEAESTVQERREAVHFNNSCYFLVQRER